jgi:serine/threonine protein kinase
MVNAREANGTCQGLCTQRLTETDVIRPTAAQFEAMFKVQGRLGSGAFGDVYKTEHEGRAYALKVLRPGGSTDPGGLLPEVAFFREARALKHCNSR